MLDKKLIREHSTHTEEKLKTKDPTISLKKLQEIDEELRQRKTEVEKKKSIRNQQAKEIGKKKQQGEDPSILLQEMEGAKEQIHALDHQIAEMEIALEKELALLPNLPAEEVKNSLDPKENVCLKEVGEKPSFPFPSKNHLELNEALHLFDCKRGVKLSGSGWVTYKGLGARLEWALIQFMLDAHITAGFTPWIPPLLVRSAIAYGSAHLPKFEEQLYKVEEKENPLYLIPTAEAALNGLHFEEILSKEELPLRYVAYTPCFRREAGAAGAQERGLIRTHQFNKVELFCITLPEESEKTLPLMIEQAEKILQGLELPYREMLLVSGDMSFAAAKTIDLEVWLPGQNRYYEVSSLSNCTDFQARRSRIRYKEGKEKPQFVHTLNGSGLATSRLMVGLLEHHQQADGSVRLPKALHPYMGGITEITPGKQSHRK